MSSIHTATFLRSVRSDSVATQRLYRLNPPVEQTSWDLDEDKDVTKHHEYVVVSAITNPVETYIFGADSKGNIVDWTELTGSYRGGTDHEKALSNAGYVVTR